MDVPKTDVGGLESGGPRPARSSGGFTRREPARQPMPQAVLALKGDASSSSDFNPLPIGKARLSYGHDGPFPLRKHLCGPAGEFFRAGRTDPGRGPKTDQIEPAARPPSRPRSGSAG